MVPRESYLESMFHQSCPEICQSIFLVRPCDRKTDQHYLASCSIFVIIGRSAQILETVDIIGTHTRIRASVQNRSC